MRGELQPLRRISRGGEIVKRQVRGPESASMAPPPSHNDSAHTPICETSEAGVQRDCETLSEGAGGANAYAGSRFRIFLLATVLLITTRVNCIRQDLRPNRLNIFPVKACDALRNRIIAAMSSLTTKCDRVLLMQKLFFNSRHFYPQKQCNQSTCVCSENLPLVVRF